jgi:hypothetical protein
MQALSRNQLFLGNRAGTFPVSDFTVLGTSQRQNQAGAAMECVRKALDFPFSLAHAHHTFHHLACIYAVLGDIEKAMAWLEKSVDTGFPCWLFFRVDPSLENLRGEPRFQRLIEDLERKYTTLKISRT